MSRNWRPQTEDGWDVGARRGMQLQQMLEPLLQQKRLEQARKWQLEDYDRRRTDRLSDIEAARTQGLEDFQRDMQLKQAMGQVSGIHTTPINQATKDRPASIGAMPVNEGDPKDLMVASPGVFVSPGEMQQGHIENLIRQKRLQDLLNPPKPEEYSLKEGERRFRRNPETGKDEEIANGGQKGTVQKPLEWKDMGGYLAGYDPFSGQEVIRHEKKPGQKWHNTAQGLYVFDENEPNKGSIVPGTGPSKQNEASTKPLTEAERNALLSAAGSGNTLKETLSDYDKLNQAHLSANPWKLFGLAGKVGPIAGRASEVGSSMGVGDTDFETFNTKLKASLFSTARSLQGAGVLTEQDIRRMEEITPTGKQTRGSFIGKLDGMREVMLNKLIPFKQFNYNRLSNEEKQALDQTIMQLSQPVAEGYQGSPSNNPIGGPQHGIGGQGNADPLGIFQ
jgi:hypothetical protein